MALRLGGSTLAAEVYNASNGGIGSLDGNGGKRPSPPDSSAFAELSVSASGRMFARAAPAKLSWPALQLRRGGEPAPFPNVPTLECAVVPKAPGRLCACECDDGLEHRDRGLDEGFTRAGLGTHGLSSAAPTVDDEGLIASGEELVLNRQSRELRPMPATDNSPAPIAVRLLRLASRALALIRGTFAVDADLDLFVAFELLDALLVDIMVDQEDDGLNY
eukprot:scaffold9114_cov118-Isochrysis_galbana.AAC.8